MEIYSETNLYPGINPHLNSALQRPWGGWQSFHTYQIIDLDRILNEILPQPYYAKPEESIQIRFIDPPEDCISKSDPDILILRQRPFLSSTQVAIVEAPADIM